MFFNQNQQMMDQKNHKNSENNTITTTYRILWIEKSNKRMNKLPDIYLISSIRTKTQQSQKNYHKQQQKPNWQQSDMYTNSDQATVTHTK